MTAVLFLNIKGAFPNAVPSVLVHNLRKRRIPAKYVNFVNSMLRNRITTLKFDGYTSEPIQVDNGIGQGDLLSMVLYQYYNADLLEILNHKDEAALAYVDDTLMLATGDTFEEAHDKLANMMEQNGGIADWSTRHNSLLEYSKLALIDFAHKRSSKPRPPLKLQQREVKPSESTKYLGIIFDQHLKWDTQQAHAIEKGAKWTAQIRRLARHTWGITPKHARKLYISVAIPRILYAVDMWGTSSVKAPSRFIRQLTTIQCSGATTITGGLHTSPTDALDTCAHLLPAPLRLDKVCHRAATRMVTLPENHPLSKPVRAKVTRSTKRHSSPLHNLLRQYSTNPEEVEKLPSSARNPSKADKLPFTIRIPEDRESSIDEANNADETIKVFTDGSATEGKVGAAAVLIRSGNPVRKLHFCLGLESKHTVHEAELVGILLGLHLISTEKRSGTTCAIGADNQAALKAFLSQLRNPGHHLARESL